MTSKRKKLLWAVIASTAVVVALLAHSLWPESPRSLFRKHLLSPIPETVKNLEAAASGWNNDWDVHMSFDISPVDFARILSAQQFRPAYEDSHVWTRFTNNFSWFYEDGGRTRPAISSGWEFYWAQSDTPQETKVYYLMTDKQHRKVYFTKYVAW
jgi:hypothetical protein